MTPFYPLLPFSFMGEKSSLWIRAGWYCQSDLAVLGAALTLTSRLCVPLVDTDTLKEHWMSPLSGHEYIRQKTRPLCNVV
jgi:hypothetical protein